MSDYLSLLNQTNNTRYRVRLLVARYLKVKPQEAKALLERIRDFHLQLDNAEFIVLIRGDRIVQREQNGDIIKSYMGSYKQLFNQLDIKFATSNFLYLDIGCGNAASSKAIGNLLSLQDDEIYGLDIIQSENKYITNYIVYDGVAFPPNLPKFNFITIFHVLHHVKDLDSMFNFINERLELGGFLLIKEHDAITDEMKLLINLEHDFYADRSGSRMDVHNYLTKRFITQILDPLGFTLIASQHNNNSPTESFFALYVKT